jgi:hypothetical protein
MEQQMLEAAAIEKRRRENQMGGFGNLSSGGSGGIGGLGQMSIGRMGI